jgi:hypothetical protein
MMVLLVADLERAPFFMRERECSTCLLMKIIGYYLCTLWYPLQASAEVRYNRKD